MVPNLFLLIYTASDYAFSNNSLIYKHDNKEIQKSLIWTVLIAIALTFDLLTTLTGLVSVTIYTAILIGLTFLKSRSNKKSWYISSELINLGLALVFTIPLAGWISSHSYLQPPFVNYLLGLTIASVVFTDLFRRFGYIPIKSGDSDGSFERILLFIFVMALQWWYVSFTLVGMIVYRFIRYRKFSKMWLISPAVGIGFSLLWLLLMRSNLI